MHCMGFVENGTGRLDRNFRPKNGPHALYLSIQKIGRSVLFSEGKNAKTTQLRGFCYFTDVQIFPKKRILIGIRFVYTLPRLIGGSLHPTTRP